ncbi:MAG: YdbH domain-containing protein [Opitutaceae bacterium]|nr:YdbH domain-containing protein [Opitutaceae bacterium]
MELQHASQAGSWTLNASSISVEQWIAPLSGYLGLRDSLGDFRIAGNLQGEASGTISRGSICGRLHCRLSDASLSSDTRGLRVEGLNVSLDLEGPAPLLSQGTPTLSFREARFNQVIARNGHIAFSLSKSGALYIAGARLDLFGGAVEIRDETIPLQSVLSREVSLGIHLSNLSLAEISAMLPDVIAEAHGRLSGQIRVAWSAKNGFKFGNGRFQIDRAESVEIRFNPQPGFLTSHTPERLTILPAWTGVLQRWFSPKNPAYESLRQIEMGLMSLHVETLSVELHPAGDAQGRTATVRISARPAVSSAVDRIDFEVNVSGPLDEVIRLGMDKKVSIKNGGAR